MTEFTIQNQNKECCEDLSLNDSLKGYVYIYQDGKLVVEGHNLIVNSGRQFVKDVFMDSAFAISVEEEDGVKYNDYKFYKAYFGKTGVNNFVTQNTTTFENIKNSAVPQLTKYLAIIGNNTENTAVITSDLKNRKFKIEMELRGTSDSTTSISEIYLTFKKYDKENNIFAESGSEVLFSRFVFDPIFIGTNINSKIVYYISF